MTKHLAPLQIAFTQQFKLFNRSKPGELGDEKANPGAEFPNDARSPTLLAWKLMPTKERPHVPRRASILRLYRPTIHCATISSPPGH